MKATSSKLLLNDISRRAAGTSSDNGLACSQKVRMRLHTAVVVKKGIHQKTMYVHHGAMEAIARNSRPCINAIDTSSFHRSFFDTPTALSFGFREETAPIMASRIRPPSRLTMKRAGLSLGSPGSKA